MSYKTEPLLQELLKACDAINKDAAVRKHISEDSVLRDNADVEPVSLDV